MPNNHSPLYRTPNLVRVVDDKKQLNHVRLKELIDDGTISYDSLSDLLREVNDAQFDIVSTLEPVNQWVRDATASKPLNQRMPHDSPVIEANNMLLRLLSRLRPIDYAIKAKLGHDESLEVCAALRNDFSELTEMIMVTANGGRDDDKKLEFIKKQELIFNNKLIKYLHESDLTPGITSPKEAQKLLRHYRNLSSVLIPARTLVTLTYDDVGKVLQRETQYPVTKKTETQKQAIETLKEITPYPGKDQKSAHTKLNYARQEVDKLFADLIKGKDRALPAQTRKTHLAGAKNAFIVKSELFFDVEAIDIPNPRVADPGNVLWLARMGSPAYIGGGETKNDILIHTKEVLEQIRAEAKIQMGLPDDQILNLHLSILNTDTPLEHQTTIVDNIHASVEGTGDSCSYLPTNWDGTNRMIEIAEMLNFDGLKKPRGMAPSDKEARLQSVSHVMRAAANTPGVLSVVNCASGQDRTGTAVEKTEQDRIKECYERYNQANPANPIDPANIEITRARGGNAAEITTHHVHGSPGMKEESQAGHTFSEEVNKQFYRKSAGTNKKNKVSDVEFLKKPSVRTLNAYYVQLQLLQGNLGDLQAGEVKKTGQILIDCVIAMSGATVETGKPVDSKTLYHLTQVVGHTTKTLNELPNIEKTKQNVQILANLTQDISGKSPRFRALGFALMFFGCAVCVCIGVLAAIPSAGTSLPVLVAGIAGLNALSIGIASGSIGAAMIGAGVAGYHHESALVSKLSLFSTKVKQETIAASKVQRNEVNQEVPLLS